MKRLNVTPLAPTFSSLELAERCGWWLRGDVRERLGEIVEAPDGGSAYGSAFHELADGAIVRGGPPSEQQLANVADRFALSAAEVDQLAATMVTLRREWARLHGVLAQSEVAVAYDLDADTARLLPTSGPRDYSDCGPREIPGTLDAVWLEERSDGKRCLFVRDWKTGPPMFTTPARFNLQLHAQALCMARIHEGLFDLVFVEIGFVDEDGGCMIDQAQLTALDLDTAAASLAAAMPSDDPQPQPGEHCHGKHCSARTICPATVELAEQVGAELDAREPGAIVDPAPGPFQVEILNGAHARWLLDRKRLVLALVDHVSAALKAWANEHGGIDVGGGKVWSAGDVARDIITPDRDALGGFGLTPDEIHELLAPATISKTRITKQLGKERGAELIEHLRAAGHVKPTSYERFDTRKRPKKETT